MRKYISFFIILLLFAGCKQVPDGVLNRQKMEDVLYEVHIAEAIMDEYPTQYRTTESKQKLMAAVFRDNGITKAEFDSSMVYYGAHLDQYMKIYQKVSARLTAQKEIAANDLLAYEHSLQTPVGDSVDIWKKESEQILNPALLAATSVFEIKGDSNFHANDRLVWNMCFRSLPVDSLGYVYVSFGSSVKDSVVQVTGIPEKLGWFTLELTTAQLSSNDKLFGSVSIINRQDTVLSPVYIDSISLMRYHPKEQKTPNNLPADSLQTDSVKADSGKMKTLQMDSIKK